MAASTADDPLSALAASGQSVWLRHGRKRFIGSGALERHIRDDGVRGLVLDRRTLIAGLDPAGDADAVIREEGEDAGAGEVWESMLVQQARRAADALAPLWEKTDGAHGLVSLPLEPYVEDAEGLTRELHRLRERVGRPNVLFQVPGTRSGCAVLEAMAAEGQGVHVTDLYSVGQHERAARAYRAGVERFADGGGDPHGVTALASVCLVPLDVRVDDLLRERVRGSRGDTSRVESLVGMAAIAVAKLAYRSQRRIFSGAGWESVTGRGARPLHLAWDRTASKNPLHREVRYVEELVGPDTVAVLSPTTLESFRRQGRVEETLERDLARAREAVDDLASAGIELEAVGAEMQRQAQERAREHVDEALRLLRQRREELEERRPPGLPVLERDGWPGAESSAALDEMDFGVRLWAKDATLWSEERDGQEAVRNRLGWLDVVETMLEEHRPVCWFAEELAESDLEQAVLLGMGGSSLSAEVCRRVFDVEDFRVLDSTLPGAVQAVAEGIDPARTLMLVSSKSGTTTETRALFDQFYAQATPMLARPGERFVAITDPGTPLEQVAHERRFRRVWLNPPDIGGRYSALSLFGLVPMAVMDLDVDQVLDKAFAMVQACRPEMPTASNPGLALGAALHDAWEDGRDKLTLVGSSRLRAFGCWAEQLVAESTGKDGVGLVPVDDEPLGEVDLYADDRLFVYLRLDGEDDAEQRRRLDEIAARHPVVELVLDGPHALGAEFFRWEVAVATAGALMGINPFDEPDVKESKERTRELLERYGEAGSFDEGRPVYEEAGIRIRADLERDRGLSGRAGGNLNLVGWLRAHLGRAEPPDYVAIQVFLPPDERTRARLQRVRRVLLDSLGVATTFGWGPRFLHSTGQLHKGGPDRGVFLQVFGTGEQDLEVPARGFSFGTLARAQALGDQAALLSRGRRMMGVDLTGELRLGVERLASAIEEAVEER